MQRRLDVAEVGCVEREKGALAVLSAVAGKSAFLGGQACPPRPEAPLA